MSCGNYQMWMNRICAASDSPAHQSMLRFVNSIQLSGANGKFAQVIFLVFGWVFVCILFRQQERARVAKEERNSPKRRKNGEND